MIAKRGVTIEAVYFHAPPYTSERAKQKVVDLAKLVSKYATPINFMSSILLIFSFIFTMPARMMSLLLLCAAI